MTLVRSSDSISTSAASCPTVPSACLRFRLTAHESPSLFGVPMAARCSRHGASISQTDALLQGTEGADQPFFSTDGQWIAFFAGGKLRKVPVQGGTSVAIADARNPRGGSWGEDGAIVAALTNTSGLSRVPARWRRAPTVDDAPGWRTDAPLAAGAARQRRGALHRSLRHDQQLRERFHRRALACRRRQEDRVAWWISRALHSNRRKARASRVRAPRRPPRRAVRCRSARGGGHTGTAGSGSRERPGIWRPAGSTMRGAACSRSERATGVQAWTVGRLAGDGKIAPLLSKPAMYYSPRFSPDGRRLAVAIDAGKGMDIVVHDFERDTTSPITFNAETNADPVWTSDGAHFVFRSLAANSWHLWWIRADGAGGPQPLLANAGQVGDLSANAMSHDNRRLIYTRTDPVTAGDLWIVPVDPSDPDHPKAGQPELFLTTPANETRPAFSPDGRWVAYNSNESGTMKCTFGRSRVLRVRVGSGRSRAAAVAHLSGREPHVSSISVGPSQIMVSDYTVRGSSFEASKPRVWSKQRLFQTAFTNFDLAPDGKQFAIVPDASASPTEVRVTMLLNFFDRLHELRPGAQR